MSWESKVVWTEGLFVQPHHFQQHDRYVEALVAGLARRAIPYAWGISELTVDLDLLKLGKVAITSVTGLTPDGAPFRVPETEEHPMPLQVPNTVKNAVVYLAVPTRRPGAVEVDLSGAPQSASRFQPAELEITDTMGQERRPTIVAVGKLRLQLALDLDDLADRLVIPIARIIEVRPDGEILLDRAFIPTAVTAQAAPPLAAFLQELEGLLSHRATALAARMGESGPAKGVAEISDFLLLMVVNRTLPQLRHLIAIETAHPQIVYQFCAGLAGELATFMAPNKTPEELALYRHDDLTHVFQPVMRTLRQYLSAVLEQTAVSIKLELRRYGVYVGLIADRQLITQANFVMAVKAEVPAEAIRRHFPSQAKVGPVEGIRQLVNSALPGIALRPLPVAPRQIPYHAGVVYMELDPDSPLWKQMTTSGGMAVHVAGEFPGLEMELWAVRRG